MEGKLTYQRTLPKQETERVFNLIKFQRDQFISVDAMQQSQSPNSKQMMRSKGS